MALGDSSESRASCSSRVGGKPVRSKVTRRNQVNLSAGPKGTTPLLAHSSARKRSIPLVEADGAVFGRAGSTIAFRDQRFSFLVTSLTAELLRQRKQRASSATKRQKREGFLETCK